MTRVKDKNIADLVSDAIDTGANSVEQVHRAIAEMPLSILESIDVLNGPIGEVRKVQDQSIGAIYDMIRSVNAEVGKLASKAFDGSK